MTFIHIDELEKRRQEGLSPKGGPVDPEVSEKLLKFGDPTEMTPHARARLLTNILEVAWNHPLDGAVTGAVSRLVGGGISLADISGAADYVYRERTGILDGQNLKDLKPDYDYLVEKARNL